ncbi:TRAP transporter substrate-binding protein DctP [Methylobacterium sp. A49B]|nr:TRAP transporter substrate-binding protein DctP [Methylobacterium mesophilicum]
MMRRLLISVAAALLVPAAARADERLRLADSLPVGHFFAESGTRFFMDRVKEISGGKVAFEYYPAEQLGKAKDLLSLTRSGIVDVGYVVPSYTSDKMPLSAVAELPGPFVTACQRTLAYDSLARTGPIDEAEFKPNGVHMLFTLVAPAYQLFTASRRIEGLKSMAGLKVRTTGGAMDATVKHFDGIPVRMAAPDLYQSLSRGTVDGLLFPYASVVSYDLGALTKFGTTGINLGSAALTYVIGLDRWKRLSPDARAALEQAGQEATRHACEAADRDSSRDQETLRGKGVTLEPFPEADRTELVTASDAIAKDWATSLDKRGKPGTAVLDAFRNALARTH